MSYANDYQHVQQLTRLCDTAFWMVVIVTFVLMQCCATLTNAQEIDINEVIPSDYDSSTLPETEYGPLNVSVSAYMNDLLKVTEASQVDLFLFQEWYDPRLNVNQLKENLVITQPDAVKKFWIPDTYFANSKNAKIVNSLQSMQKLIITKDGLMHYMLRFNGQFSCPMYLLNYPHDYQTCQFHISSFTHNQSELIYVWEDFEVNNWFEYPKFKIRSWWTGECKNSGVFFGHNSCISGTVKLVRRLSYYLIRYYFVTFLCVAVSFIGFWLPVHAWPARANITVSPLLSLITLDGNINKELGVAYVVAIQMWMMFLQAFVYLAIIEYAFAIAWAHLVMEKKNYAKMVEKEAKFTDIAIITPPPPPPPPKGYYFGNKGCFAKCGQFFDKFVYFFFGDVDLKLDPYSRNKVDYVCRILFVFVFLLFVLIYSLATCVYWSANYY